MEQEVASVVVRPIACAGSERAAGDGVREPERRPGPAPLGARASVRHRARGDDRGKEETCILVARRVVAEHASKV
jgi:hypothetical protein